MKFTKLLASALWAAFSIQASAQLTTNVCGTNGLSALQEVHLDLSQFDTNGDGTISSNELAAAAVEISQGLQTNLFARFDANSDGVITSEEILAVTEGAAEVWVTNLLSRLDVNKDGSLSAAELRRGGRRLGHGGLASYDTNSDGVLTSDELIAAATGQATNQQANVLARYDTDSDGTITLAEAFAVNETVANGEIAEVLARLDTNDDGEISSAELAAAHRAHRGPGWR